MDYAEAHVDATAAVLGLKIPAESRPAVMRYFALAAGMAEPVMSMPLTTADESGSVFVPVEPAGQP